jgi:hypothetical protein
VERAVVEQLLDEIISALVDLETKAAATLQFLKDKEHVTDEELAPYLEQAGNASEVRWRAARLRMMSLLSSALKSIEAPKEEAKAPPKSAKNTDAEKTQQASALARAGEPAQPQSEEEPQPAAPAKDSKQKQPATESAKAPEPHSRESKSRSTEEQQPLAEAKEPARESNPSKFEEDGKTPLTAGRESPPKSNEDAA